MARSHQLPLTYLIDKQSLPLSPTSLPPRPPATFEAKEGLRLMASTKQIEANRKNARKSTGPRTLRGKSISRLNALTHCIYAEVEVIPDEDPEQLRELAHSYIERWEPSLDEERYLVDNLVRCDWRMRRLNRVEACLWNHLRCQEAYHFHEQRYSRTLSLNGLALERDGGAFNRLQRRMDSTHRSYMGTLATLQDMAQAAAERLEAHEAAQAAEAAQAETAEAEETTPNILDLLTTLQALIRDNDPDEPAPKQIAACFVSAERPTQEPEPDTASEASDPTDASEPNPDLSAPQPEPGDPSEPIESNPAPEPVTPTPSTSHNEIGFVPSTPKTRPAESPKRIRKVA